MFYPLYSKFLEITKKEVIASSIVIIILFLIMVLPLAFVLSSLSKEAVTGYASVNKILNDESSFDLDCEEEGLFCRGITSVKRYASDPEVRNQFTALMKGFINFFVEKSSAVILSIPKKILDLFIFFFVTFFLFIDGKKIINDIWDMIKVREKDKKAIKGQISDVTYAVVYGSVMVSLIQGMLAGIGYFIFGIKAPIFLGLLSAIAALLPYIGTGLVWFPVAMIQILLSIISSDTSGIFRGVGLFLYCALFVSTIDNILKPKIIGDRGNIHPVTVLIGVLGGIKVFGLIGIIVGPLVLELLLTFINMYKRYSSTRV